MIDNTLSIYRYVKLNWGAVSFQPRLKNERIQIQIETSTKMYTPFLIGLN